MENTNVAESARLPKFHSAANVTLHFDAYRGWAGRAEEILGAVNVDWDAWRSEV